MSNEYERMHAAVTENPKIGRILLSRIAQVPMDLARKYLEEVRHISTTPAVENTAGVKSNDPLESLSVLEKDLIRKAMQREPARSQTFEWSQESFKFAAMGDTHIGHIKSKLDYWQRACDLIEKENCAVVLHTGDITEGMSGREGHFYELEAAGATAQIDMAVDRMKLIPCEIYALNGNHDMWGYKKIGLDVAKTIDDRLPNFHSLGIHEADFNIGNLCIKLFHGEDGASYATSYRTQKFIEGLSGGEKPSILLAGHDHKSIFHVCRNVMTFGTGTLCGQTQWMRNKKLAAHVGFWIIEVWMNEDGIERIKQEWIPFFKDGNYLEG